MGLLVGGHLGILIGKMVGLVESLNLRLLRQARIWEAKIRWSRFLGGVVGI